MLRGPGFGAAWDGWSTAESSFPSKRKLDTGVSGPASTTGVTLGPLGNLQAERPLTIRERVRGANGYLRVETRAGLDATVLLSTDLRSWNSLRTLKLEPGMNEVAVPETPSDAEFLRLVW